MYAVVKIISQDDYVTTGVVVRVCTKEATAQQYVQSMVRRGFTEYAWFKMTHRTSRGLTCIVLNSVLQYEKGECRD